MCHYITTYCSVYTLTHKTIFNVGQQYHGKDILHIDSIIYSALFYPTPNPSIPQEQELWFYSVSLRLRKQPRGELDSELVNQPRDDICEADSERPEPRGFASGHGESVHLVG